MFSTPIWSQNSLNTCKKILWWKRFIKFITLFSCHCLAIKNQTTIYTLNSMPSPAWKVQTSTESKNLLFILPPPHPPGLFPCFSYLLFSSFWLNFRIIALEGRRCSWVSEQDYHWTFRVNFSWFYTFFSGPLDWTFLIWSWFQRSFPPAQVKINFKIVYENAWHHNQQKGQWSAWGVMGGSAVNELNLDSK